MDVGFKGRGEGITQEMIEAVRRNTHVGQKIWIVSYKTEPESRANVSASGGERSRHRVRATVIRTDHPRFCVCQMAHGVKEYVLWIDLVQERMGEE